MSLLSHWSPFEQMQQELERTLNTWEPTVRKTPNPLAEVIKTPEGYRLRLLVPGVDPGQIDISVSERVLTVSGCTTADTLADEETVVVNEIPYGAFSKEFTLPHALQAENISATYRHGILDVTLKHAPASNTAKVAIQVL